jgi:hypothetical protein
MSITCEFCDVTFSAEDGHDIQQCLEQVARTRDSYKKLFHRCAGWAEAAFQCLGRGADLMPLHHLSQWEGVRGVIESYPGQSSDECKAK